MLGEAKDAAASWRSGASVNRAAMEVNKNDTGMQKNNAECGINP
jgi:hypothetical protein